MALTVKSSYALRALFELAVLTKDEGKDRVTISELSEKQNIPKDFLEKIFSELREGWYIKINKRKIWWIYFSQRPKGFKIK